MTTVVALLRAVNLAGHNRIGMDALKELFASLGFAGVRTYIQSGNVLFRTERTAGVRRRIEDAFEREFGFRSDVILRTEDELRSVVARNPFAARRDLDAARIAVTFLASDPGPAARKKLLDIKIGPEELVADGCELYIYHPDGMGRSKLPVAAIGKALGVPGTSRNWRTVTKLLELAGASAPR
jgi:uncharacterized protein (DUF1697 family)